ncbi:protein APCDD1-like [Dendronephthya gigantea]|uniref:protein APCDD1-like n=1 Tax=Dendronephthya gigantea TaxID=151771 RepID=UPI00106A5D34|nr:protein APCDD1-like [Dendronephthya gigantea]
MGTTSGLIVSLAFFFLCARESLANYQLTAGQCNAAMENIGEILKSKQPDNIYKGTFVSPRCELRRIQERNQNKMRTSFLLRSIEVTRNKRWIGYYYFYRDQDCVHPTYGLKLQGKTNYIKKNLTLSITSLSIAVYTTKDKIEIEEKYNRSCSGNLTTSDSGTSPDAVAVYSVYRKDISNNECLKSLGVEKREFASGAAFETHEPSGGDRSDLLLQTVVDLTKSKNSVVYQFQWPLVRHDTRMCLTCSRVGLARLKHPPKLYKRNATSLDGVWASVRCQKINRDFWTTKIDTFSGNDVDFAFYQMDHTLKLSPYMCQKPLLEVHTVGTIRLIGNSVEVPGGVVYELYVNHMYMTPRNRFYEQVFNTAAKGTCGVQGEWEVGKTQDVVKTGGCAMIGYVLPKGTATQVLIRTLQDEKRKEMYVGFGGPGKKLGPLDYDQVAQSCETFPLEITTTPGPTYMTSTEQTETTTEPVENNFDDNEAPIVIKNVRATEPPSSSGTLNDGSIRVALVLCLLFLHAVRLA